MDRGSAGGPWSFLLVDIDQFKALNDAFGHLVGDAFLVEMARVIQAALTASARKGSLARYGGDEFGIILPGATAAAAAKTAESIRASVAAAHWRYGGGGEPKALCSTISVGVVEYRRGDSVPSLVRRADEALYAAKRAGRNRVVTAE